jgi:Uma2 family endonuclease
MKGSVGGCGPAGKKPAAAAAGALPWRRPSSADAGHAVPPTCYLGIVLDPREIAPERARRLSRAEYDRMVAMGMFTGERVELLHGVVIEMTPIDPPHGGAVQRLTRILLLALDPRAAVRVQSPFAASDHSEPEPDLAVVPPGDYDDAHPGEAYLLVEVAASSLTKDRGVKAALYASCGVPEYWVVNLVDQLIEVHTDIVRGTYARVVAFRKGERITLQRFPDVSIAVSDALR